MRHLVPRPHLRAIYHTQQLIGCLPLLQHQQRATRINRWICSERPAHTHTHTGSEINFSTHLAARQKKSTAQAYSFYRPK